MKQMVQWWNEAGYGVRWGYRGEKLLTHAIWADNIWIFATSHGMYQAMVDILTNRLEAMKLRWTPASLEYMVVSDSPAPENQRITVSSVLHSEDGKGEKVLVYKRTQHLDTVGVRLDTRGSTWTSVQARLAIANATVHADIKSWRSKGSRLARIKAFERHIHPRALHGSRTWHITDKILHELRRWENKTVASILGMRPKVLPGGCWRSSGGFALERGKK